MRCSIFDEIRVWNSNSECQKNLTKEFSGTSLKKPRVNLAFWRSSDSFVVHGRSMLTLIYDSGISEVNELICAPLNPSKKRRFNPRRDAGDLSLRRTRTRGFLPTKNPLAGFASVFSRSGLPRFTADFRGLQMSSIFASINSCSTISPYITTLITTVFAILFSSHRPGQAKNQIGANALPSMLEADVFSLI